MSVSESVQAAATRGRRVEHEALAGEERPVRSDGHAHDGVGTNLQPEQSVLSGTMMPSGKLFDRCEREEVARGAGSEEERAGEQAGRNRGSGLCS